MDFKLKNGNIADQVCAVVDIQGFMLGKKFYPREVAIKSESFISCFLVDHGLLLKDLSALDKRRVDFQTRHLHGLSFEHTNKNEDFITLAHLPQFVFEIYSACSTDDKKLLTCKSFQTAQYLQEIDLPFISIEEICECPNSYELLRKCKPCSLHENTDLIVKRCAQRKCEMLWKIINSPQQMNM